MGKIVQELRAAALLPGFLALGVSDSQLEVGAA
jgi:hypothetical protein